MAGGGPPNLSRSYPQTAELTPSYLTLDPGNARDRRSNPVFTLTRSPKPA